MKKRFITPSTLVSVLGLGLAAATFSVQAVEPEVINRYSKSCVICHASGAGNAPKTGVVADWTPRLEKGMDTLVSRIKEGKIQGMPPNGMCMDCSADDFKALIEYMATAK